MPWHIERRGEKVCVIKTSTGEVKHCYDRRREALMYLRALYSHAGPEARGKEKK